MHIKGIDVKMWYEDALYVVVVCRSKILLEGSGYHNKISCEKFTPHLHKALSNEHMKWYFR